MSDSFDRYINEDPGGGGVPAQTIDFWLTIVFCIMIALFLIMLFSRKK